MNETQLCKLELDTNSLDNNTFFKFLFHLGVATTVLREII